MRLTDDDCLILEAFLRLEPTVVSTTNMVGHTKEYAAVYGETGAHYNADILDRTREIVRRILR